MSNVLIGIIGVVLFIGLALAGALILGADFMTATSESRAAAATAQLQQASQAVTMFNLKTGSVYPASGNPTTPGTAVANPFTNLVPRFLETVPVNPVDSTGTAPKLVDENGAVLAGETKAAIIQLALTARMADVCISVARSTGQLPATSPLSGSSTDAALNAGIGVTAIPANHAGCFKTTAAIGSIPINTYVIYQRV